MLELEALHPELRPWAQLLVRELRRAGYRVTVTSVYRSRAEQARLYARYLQGLNPYPVARPGTSAHELRIAWDMDVRSPGGGDGAPDAGAVWQEWGGRWTPRDRVHFTI